MSTFEKLKDTKVCDRLSSISIVYWIQQYVLSKLNNAVKNRKKNQVSKSLPGLQSHRGTAARPLSDDSHTASMRDSEQVSSHPVLTFHVCNRRN